MEPSQGYLSKLACFVMAEWPLGVADPSMYRNPLLLGGPLPWGRGGLDLVSWGSLGVLGPLGASWGLFGGSLGLTACLSTLAACVINRYPNSPRQAAR